MPKGNAEITDQILLNKLGQIERPVTINDLATRLNWSRGKIDGSVNRLLNREEVAVVKLSSPRGQRRRYVGLPEVFNKDFFQERVVNQKNILVNDPLGTLQSFTISSEETAQTQIHDLENKINELKREIEEKTSEIKNYQNQNIEYKTHIDPSLIEVIEKQIDLINRAAEQQNVTPAELLGRSIPQITDPNFDLLTKIVSIVVSESQKENDSIEKRAAISFLRRARSL